MTGVVSEHGVTERRTAIEYAEHGWSVLPGSKWNGHRWMHTERFATTDGLRPTMARNYATSDPATVAQWWTRTGPGIPSILLRTDATLGAVHVSAPLATQVLRTNAFRDASGPVIFRPDRQCAYFLVCPDETVVVPEDAPPGAVVPLARGELIAAPPTVTGAGNVTWWHPPQKCDWQPMTARALSAAFRAAVASIPHR